jgi:DNA-binding response OmpR family regulator
MRTVIVDDSVAMRMIVEKTLRQAGFAGQGISEAEDGAGTRTAAPGPLGRADARPSRGDRS